LTVPGEKTAIVCEGEVVNVPSHQSFGMGVRFTNLADEDRRRIESFTAELEKRR
jgi:hypothetical protein